MKKLIIGGILLLAAFFLFFQPSEEVAINDNVVGAGAQNTAGSSPVKENGGYKAVEEPGNFSFQASILDSWQTEVISSGQIINFYNTEDENESSLESSQIFASSYVANNFQVDEDLNILSREESEVAGLPAVTYVISQNGKQVFSGGPAWQEETHKITQVRISEQNPSRFYVFAKNPNLSEAEFKRFLDSLEF